MRNREMNGKNDQDHAWEPDAIHSLQSNFDRLNPDLNEKTTVGTNEVPTVVMFHDVGQGRIRTPTSRCHPR